MGRKKVRGRVEWYNGARLADVISRRMCHVTLSSIYANITDHLASQSRGKTITNNTRRNFAFLSRISRPTLRDRLSCDALLLKRRDRSALYTVSIVADFVAE